MSSTGKLFIPKAIYTTLYFNKMLAAFFHILWILWAPVIAWHKFWCAFFIKGYCLCCQPSGDVFFQLVSAVELLTTEERIRRKKGGSHKGGKVRAVRRVVKLVPAKVR